MSIPTVCFLFPDGSAARVPAGGIIGRMLTAALRLDDQRVSEAHAMISLRGEYLWVLALRGTVEVDGAVVREALLRRGATLRLSPDTLLVVDSLDVCPDLLAIELPGCEPQLLRGDIMSVVDADAPMLIARFAEHALLRLWTNGVGWRGQALGGGAFDIEAGRTFALGDLTVRFRSAGVGRLAATPTVGGGLQVPLVLRSALEELRIEAPSRATLFISGVPARIVRELADYQEPVSWELIASPVLGPDDRDGLRARWDRNLKSLRRKLEEGGCRSDLVRTDGHGNVSLALGPGDRLDVI